MRAKNIIDLIGNTALIRLQNETTGLNQNIYVKLEYLNPSGSIKDRVALYTIKAAEKAKQLQPGGTIIEASTGNTAIAFSFVGCMLGYKVRIYMSEEVAVKEKVNSVKLYGGEVRLVGANKKEGSGIAVSPRQHCLDAEKNEENVWWARQFANPSNPLAHKETTGAEILKQTGGEIDAFVASVGTAGTLLGVGRALKEHNPRIKLVGVEPTDIPIMRNGREGVEIIDGISGGLVLDALELSDEIVVIENEEAVAMTNNLTLKEGLFCGISSGANVLAAIRIAKKYPDLKNIVTVLPDRRDRYYTAERYTT